jgi:hypothetical protein
VTFEAGALSGADGGALAAGVTDCGGTRGGTATGVLAVVADDGGVATGAEDATETGGAGGVFGGMTTTDGGRY